VALRLPRAQLQPLVSGVDDLLLRRIPYKAEALQLLTSYLKAAAGLDAAKSRRLQHLVVNHVYDLLALAVGATRGASEMAQGRGVRAARLHAIKEDIARSLDCGDLSVTMPADRHNCTPRLAQRLFESEGTTFTDYVLAQRLARAHRHLTDPRRDGEKVSTIAYDCGFGDVSYFNRVFRRQYGATPSDIRAQSQSGGIDGEVLPTASAAE
jgi:AraC-like DNA-binding protein